MPPVASLAALPADAPPSERKRQQLRLTLRDKVDSGTLPEEAELGELGIEGEEDVGSGPAGRKRERSTEAAVWEPVVEDNDAAVESRPTKRTRSEAGPTATAPPTEDASEEAPTEEGGAKKENRKQRKERKRAEAEAGAAPTPAKEAKGKADKGSKARGKSSNDASAGKSLAAEDDFFA